MRYSEALDSVVKTPTVKEGFYSGWAQYSVLLDSEEQRNGLQAALKDGHLYIV
ncbi:MAG: hypothetical protein PUC30_00035 [Lachnospiraceae bacterium]|nr:hypothetical protein [Lachnospiraceae bacterium]